MSPDLATRLRMTQGALRAAVILLIISLVTGGASLWFTSHEIHAVQAANASSCKFFSDLAGAPVTVNPVTHKAALLAVSIVADSRVAWRGRDCPGELPPPDPSFIRWARYWHLPVN